MPSSRMTSLASVVCESARSLHSFMVVLIVAGLAVTTSVSMAMMSEEISRTREERLGAQLSTASKALVATLEERLKVVLAAQNTTANVLSMDPSLAEPADDAIADPTPDNRQPMLHYGKNFLETMLATQFQHPDFNNFGFFHRNGRIQLFSHFFGRASGMWEYCEATPSTWVTCMSLGEPVSAGVAGQFGITCEPGVSCLGYPDTTGVMSDFRALDDTIDWGVVEMTTGVSLPGRVQLLKDGTLIDHTLCGSIVPVAWTPAWTRQTALGQGCVVAIEGVWAYNSTGANELRDGETGSIIAKNGTVLAAGSYAAFDVGAWRFTYLYGSSKYNEGRTSFMYVPYVGSQVPYFKDKADGGIHQHSISNDYSWFGPYLLSDQLTLTASTVVHTHVNSNGTRLSDGQSSFAGVILTDLYPEIISVFLRHYIEKLDVPEASRARTVAYAVTGSSAAPGLMLAVSTVTGETYSEVSTPDKDKDHRARKRTLSHVVALHDPAIYKCDAVCLTTSCNCVAAPMAESGHPLIAAAALDVTSTSFSVGGERFLMRTADFDAYKLKLLVGVIVPEEPYTLGSRRRTRVAMFVAVGISLGILLVWSAVQHLLIVRPLSQVSRGIKAMGDMRLDDAARLTPRNSSFITTIDRLLRGFQSARLHLLAWRTQETQRRVMLEKERAARNLASVVEAQTNASQLMHPMVLVSAATFLGLGKLTSYETLRGQGKLTFLDTLEQLVAFREAKKVVFLSHQWLGWGAPDPDGEHYTAMSAATKLASYMLLPGMSEAQAFELMYVWVDFGSIAQEHRGMQVMAISSLPVYSAYSDAFIVVAPPTKHAQTGLSCNLGSYATRGWCRAEMLSKVCGSGLKHMYVYHGMDDKSGDKLEPVTVESLKQLSLHVFDGNFSCCALKHVNCTRCDKQELALPVLGLYSLVLTRRSQPHMAEVAQIIQQDKARFFPSHIDFTTGEHAEHHERRPLLDGLIEVMEEYVGVKEATHEVNIICVPAPVGTGVEKGATSDSIVVETEHAQLTA